MGAGIYITLGNDAALKIKNMWLEDPGTIPDVIQGGFANQTPYLWSGTLQGGSFDNETNTIFAEDTGSFWPVDSEVFWPADTTVFWQNTYATVEYLFAFRPDLEQIGQQLLQVIVTAVTDQPINIECRTTTTAPWVSFPGSFTLVDLTYYFRITIPHSKQRTQLQQIVLDLNDATL